jgi:hypothetical protein
LILSVLAGIFGGLAPNRHDIRVRTAEASLLEPFEYLAILCPVLADLLDLRPPNSSVFPVALLLALAGAGLAAMEGRRRLRS